MVPSGPISYFVVRQACLALAALKALFNTMFRFGHACKRFQRYLGRPIGEIKGDYSEDTGLLPTGIYRIVRVLTFEPGGPHDVRSR